MHADLFIDNALLKLLTEKKIVSFYSKVVMSNI